MEIRFFQSAIPFVSFGLRISNFISVEMSHRKRRITLELFITCSALKVKFSSETEEVKMQDYVEQSKHVRMLVIEKLWMDGMVWLCEPADDDFRFLPVLEVPLVFLAPCQNKYLNLIP